MSEKKHIDRIFQEKFKDFEADPPERLWKNIEANLRKEEPQRRVLPLWFRLSGVAAILVIGLLLTLPLFNGANVDPGNNPVVFDGNNNTGGNPAGTAPAEGAARPDNNAVAPAVSPANNTAVASSDAEPAANENTGNTTGSSKNGKAGNSNSGTGSLPAFSNSPNAIAHESNSRPAAADKANGNKINTTATDAGQGVAYNEKANERVNGNKANQPQQAIGNAVNNTTITPANKNNATETAVAANGKNNSDTGVKANPVQGATPRENLINKDIAIEQAVADVATDTAAVKENELEVLYRQKLLGEDEKAEEMIAYAAKSKWNIKPQLAPVFFNSLSEGSPIDSQLAGNSKDFDNDLSYGVGVNYALSDRVTLRSGINSVNLSYATNGIQFHASLSDHTSNIGAAARNANIVIQDQGMPTGPDTASLISAGSPAEAFDGTAVQKMGYIEVPLEMSYALLNKKFGIDIIGGVSTLFLNDNNVSVLSEDGYSATVGEAQNLNNVNFSTNIGLGFSYRFTDAFKASFEPTFKYQVNTFSRDAGNFRPYFIGLYTGISFSF